MNRRGIKSVFIAVVAVVVSVVALWFWLRRDNDVFETAIVTRGTLYREIFATGKARPVEEISLSFRTGGLISKVFVSEGERVSRGETLAKLDTEELLERLDQAKAALAAQELTLEASRVQALNARYQLSAVIRDSYTKIEDVVFTRSDPFFTAGIFGVVIEEGHASYFFDTKNAQLRLLLTHERNALIAEIPRWKTDVSDEEIFADARLAVARLARTRDFLGNLALAVSDFSTDKSSLMPMIDAYRGIVSAARVSISSAMLNLESATQNLRAAESGLNPALVDQARESVEMLEVQIRKAHLEAPSNGTVFKKHAAAGEAAQPGIAVFTFHPAGDLRIEAEIYEGDIGAISAEKKAEIEFVAFPNRVFAGEVITIERAPILIGGVVYYRVALRMVDPPAGILPGMSADVSFKTVRKADALIIPEAAVRRKNGEMFVTALVGDTREDREVILGMRGDNRMVEILEGLAEKELVLLK